jgi:hypothetical protein
MVAGAGQWSAAVEWSRSQPVALLYLRAVRLPARLVRPWVLSFRFSGLRITVQDWPRRSACLLSGLRYTPIDARVRGCMRLRMRLTGDRGTAG